jgi:hypothetical protein
MVAASVAATVAADSWSPVAATASASPAQGSTLGQITADSSAKHGLHLPAVRTLVSPPIGEPGVVMLIYERTRLTK